MKPLEGEYQKKAILLTILYAAAIFFLRSYHEIWRDAAERFIMATESRTLAELFTNFHTTGHPTLWPLIMRLGWMIIKSPFLLDITAVAVATGGIYVFLSRSPFSWPQKMLFLLGYFPIYEYSVFSPHYGLSMTLLFLFCALYEKRFERPMVVACVLALLANTNAHSLIIAVALGLIWVAELGWLFFKKKYQISRTTVTIAIIVFLFGIFLAMLQIIPPKNTYLTDVYTMTGTDFLKAISQLVISPGSLFKKALGFNNAFFATSFIWVVCLLLIKRPGILFSFVLSIFGIGLLFQLVYPGYTRHQGFLYLMIIASFWMAGSNESQEKEGTTYRRTVRLAQTVFIYGLLILQAFKAYPAVYNEITEQTSSSKSLGEYLKTHPEFKNAIIIPEDDAFAHSIAYYTKNRFYLPREKRFGRFVLYTPDYKKDLYLSEVLQAAEALKHDYKDPILIVIGLDPQLGKPYWGQLPFGRSFRYTPPEIEEFRRKTRKLASFREALSDENYDLYLLK